MKELDNVWAVEGNKNGKWSLIVFCDSRKVARETVKDFAMWTKIAQLNCEYRITKFIRAR